MGRLPQPGARSSVTAQWLLLLLVLLPACANLRTQTDFYEPITADLRAQNFAAAAARIEAAAEDGKYAGKDRLLYYLDSGLAYHYEGNLELSNARLAAGEAVAEELYTKSVSKAAASMVLNDNATEYAGEDFEILYTNLFKALNYLSLNEFDEAFVEIRRANAKLGLLEQKYADAGDYLTRSAATDPKGVPLRYEVSPPRFNNDAFARYLSMHLYAADNLRDDAALDFELLQEAFRTQPHIYPHAVPDVRYETRGQPILSVVALAGRAPVKQALNLRIRTDSDLDLVQVLYTDGGRAGTEYGHFVLPVSEDYYFKLAIPRLASCPSAVRRVLLRANGQPVGELQLLEDIETVARETFEARKTLIYVRAVARAIVKGLASHKVKEKIDEKKDEKNEKNEDAGWFGRWLKKAAVDVIADVSEAADLRSTRLLPGRVLVGDFSMPAGTWDLYVDFIAADGLLLHRQEFLEYQIKPGRQLHLIEACYLN